MEEALNEITKLIEENTKITIDMYTKEYKESKWYREPTLKDVFGESVGSAVEGLYDALKKARTSIHLSRNLK